MPDIAQTTIRECLLVFDTVDENYLFISPLIKDITGYPAADFYKNANLIATLLHPSDRERVQSLWIQLGKIKQLELSYQIVTAGGSVKRVYEKSEISADEQTGHEVILSVIKSDTVAIEKPTFNNFSFLFDDNPNPMWIYEISTLNILKVNKAAVAHYGYSQEEFLQMSIFDLRPEPELEKFNSYLQGQNLTNPNLHGINNSGVWKHVNDQGGVIYAEIKSHDLTYQGLNCRAVIATDVTERVQYQRESIRIKNNLEALINNTEDLIWSIDRNRNYLYMNDAYRNKIFFDTKLVAKVGDHVYLNAGYETHIVKEWEGYYQRAFNSEHFTVRTSGFDQRSQQTLWYEVSFNPFFESAQTITGIGCFARNITARLEAENAIIDQNERLRHIASLTSHELRRPVASMLGLINIIDRTDFFNPENKQIIEHLLTVGHEIDDVIRLIVNKTSIDNITLQKNQQP